MESARRRREPGGARPRLLLTSLALLGLAASSGCAYTVSTGIPSHITSVAIPTFGNNTVQYTLSQEQTEAVVARLEKDNHLRVVPLRDAQSTLQGSVLEYRNEVFGYSAAEQAQEYRVGMRVQVRFKDLVKNKDIWSDVIMKTSNYSTAAQPGRVVGTEVTGRADVVGKVADEILSRTVSRW